jgi:hypothetical protein
MILSSEPETTARPHGLLAWAKALGWGVLAERNAAGRRAASQGVLFQSRPKQCAMKRQANGTGLRKLIAFVVFAHGFVCVRIGFVLRGLLYQECVGGLFSARDRSRSRGSTRDERRLFSTRWLRQRRVPSAIHGINDQTPAA